MPTTTLRLLQTTDLHMHVLGFDYMTDTPTGRFGLEHLLPVIEQARKEAACSLLFDNGDFLQGTPMADLLARQAILAPPTAPHPMIDAMNGLGYDAIGLGNHDFDFGLPFLRAALDPVSAPVVCANAWVSEAPAFADPWTVLDRQVTLSDGTTQTLRIGVIGLLPPQTRMWNAHILPAGFKTDDILTAATAHLPALKQAGADIVVALCHAGISDAPLSPDMENAALHLAAVPGIDVILTGHTHEYFPGPGFDGITGVDNRRATLHGKPALMPGAFADRLGQLDMTLSHEEDGGWRITDHTATLLQPAAVRAPSDAQAGLMASVAAPHKATRARLAQVLCKTARPLTSHYIALGDDTAPLLSEAMLDAARISLAGGAYADHPCLAATTCYRAGGQLGPANFTTIAAGPVLQRDIEAIVPFNNPITVVRRSGAQIRAWLEQTSQFFCTLQIGRTDQPLIDPAVPSYTFDTLFGLRYTLDLTTAPLLDGATGPHPRIKNVTLNGDPLADDTTVLVVTTSYRASGGGGFPTVPSDDVVHISKRGLADIFADHLRVAGVPQMPAQLPFRFAPAPGTAAWFATSPDVDPDRAGLSLLGVDPDGFARLRLAL